MHIPFDPIEQSEKYQFYKDMTDAINDWMLKKYPQFDNSLIDKIRKVELAQNRLEDQIREHRELISKDKSDYIKEVTNQINEFLSNTYPDIDSNLKKTSADLQKKLQKIDKTIETCKVYSSLCEDVYKMRDEFKDMKKYMDSFKTKMKRAFDI